MRRPELVDMYEMPRHEFGFYRYPGQREFLYHLALLHKGKGPGPSIDTLRFYCIWGGMPPLAVDKDYQWFSDPGGIRLKAKEPNDYGLEPNVWYGAVQAMLIARRSWESWGNEEDHFRNYLLAGFAEFARIYQALVNRANTNNNHQQFGWWDLGSSWAYTKKGIGPQGTFIDTGEELLRFSLNPYDQKHYSIGLYSIYQLKQWLLGQDDWFRRIK